jgi:para-nitrobenzyl esterase
VCPRTRESLQHFLQYQPGRHDRVPAIERRAQRADLRSRRLCVAAKRQRPHAGVDQHRDPAKLVDRAPPNVQNSRDPVASTIAASGVSNSPRTGSDAFIESTIATSVLMTAEVVTPTAPVETSAGKVRGRRKDGVSSFLGVPYGSDTTPCRFQPAQPPVRWRGVRDCIAFGMQAPQGQLNVDGMRVGEDADPAYTRAIGEIFRSGVTARQEDSENCLVLNVYTPDASPRAKRPVMVWLHGGGFSMGSAGNAQYGGSALCRRGDVVVVTLNHRLSALGYLYLGAFHDDFADSGNVGQLDMVLALRWVRDNIAAFGGDAGHVTLFGQSGGGAKVSALGAMPAAQGLFHKLIIQSGPSARMVERSQAVEIAERTLATLGVRKSDVHKLASMDRATLIRAASAAQRPSNGIVKGALAPVVDGQALPSHPFDPQASELMHDIPLLIGTNKDEWTLMTAIEPHFGTMSAEQARERFVRALGDRGDAAFDFYRSQAPHGQPTYWVTDMMTDIMMRAESIEMAESKAAQGGAPVFMYRLDWESPVLGGALRSPHCLDLPLMFENIDVVPQLVGTGPNPRAIAAIMAQAWVNFARSGNPSQPGLPWPGYAHERLTMIFDTNSRILSDPDSERRQYWSMRRAGRN